MKRIEFIYLLTGFCTICSCTSKANSEIKEVITEVHNTVTEAITEIVEKDIKPEDIRLDKELLYDKHTLKDTYPYKDTTRHFQWEKIKERLALLENIRKKPAQWCILQNYKNRNGEAPLVKSFKRDAYKRIADTLGVERYQGIPLFLTDDTLTAERYGLDGLLTRHLGEEGKFTKVEPVFIGGEWYAPTKYIKLIPDSVVFNKATMAVDTHVFRVSHRIGLVPPSCTTPLATEKELVKYIPESLIPIAHHWLILHGRYVCTARSPKCAECGLNGICKDSLKAKLG